MPRRVKTWEEYKAECEAVASPGITILGYVGEWSGTRTKLECHCEKHGSWQTTCIANFKRGWSCYQCGRESTGVAAKKRHKPDEEYIKEFMNTGVFQQGSTFKRNKERTEANGFSGYWDYTCPTCSDDEYVKAGLCSGVFTSWAGSLLQGRLPCRCAKNPQYTKEQWEFRLRKTCAERGYVFTGWEDENWGSNSKILYQCPEHGERSIRPHDLIRGKGCVCCKRPEQAEYAYINIVKKFGQPVALKFGISNNYSLRLKRQNSKNVYQMETLVAFKFPDYKTTVEAERACIKQLYCGTVEKHQLEDGWTETVALTDYDKVVSIYERFGGVRVDTLTEETANEKPN